MKYSPLKRLIKLKTYAQSKEKTVTQLVEDWIDRLPTQSNDWLRTDLIPPLPSAARAIGGTRLTTQCITLSSLRGTSRR